MTSCPTCGRTKVDVARVASEIECALAAQPALKGGWPHVAVMGCVVNGPGEAREADIALCGGDGAFALYVKGQFRERVPEADAVARVLEYVSAGHVHV